MLRFLFLSVFVIYGLGAYAQTPANGCTNLNFESADFSNWDGRIGCPDGGGLQIRMAAPCPSRTGIDPAWGVDDAGKTVKTASQHEIISTAYNGGFDPIIGNGLPVVSPLKDANGNTGEYVARLGNFEGNPAGVGAAGTGLAQGAELTYEIVVDSSNLIIQTAYAIVLESPNHGRNELPYFSIKALDPAGDEIECLTYEVTGTQGEPGFKSATDIRTPYGFEYIYRNWVIASLYLGNYFGQTVTLQFQSSDCYREAHGGWAYVDAQCDSLRLTATDDTICYEQPTILSAPPGMDDYDWYYVPDSLYRADQAYYDGIAPGNFSSTGAIDTMFRFTDIDAAGIPVVGQRIEYNRPGHYFVEMTPFSSTGESCPFRMRKQIFAHPHPDPGYINVPPNCEGQPVDLSDTTNYFNILETTQYLLNGTRVPGVSKSDHTHRTWVWDRTKNTGDTTILFWKANPTINYPNYVSLGTGKPYSYADSAHNFVDLRVHSNLDNYQPSPNLPDTCGDIIIGLEYVNEDECATFSFQEITIACKDEMVFENPGVLCTDEPPVTLVVNPADGEWDGETRTWSGEGIVDEGPVFDPAVFEGRPGSYWVYVTQSPCGEIDSLQITVEDRPNPDFDAPSEYCIQEGPLTLTPVTSGGYFKGTYVSSGGVCFGPGNVPNFLATTDEVGNTRAPEDPFEIKVQYIIPGNCPDSSETTIIVYPEVFFDFENPGSQCEVDAEITLTMNPAGGTWSGPGIVNASAGTWNPANAGLGRHNLTYTINEPCFKDTVVELEVISNPVATFDAPDTICNDATEFQLAPTQGGGLWSGLAIANRNTGLFDPKMASFGANKVYYSFSGTCSAIDSAIIVMEERPEVAIVPPGDFCNADTVIQLVATPSGGRWSGNGITNATAGTFNPSVAGIGSHSIGYTVDGYCSNAESIVIHVTSKTPVAVNTPEQSLCTNSGVLRLSGSPQNGIWTGPGIVDSVNGDFNPDTAGVGTHKIYYTVPGACGGVDSVNLSVLQFYQAEIVPVPEQCADVASVPVSVAPSGGAFSGAFTDFTGGNASFQPTNAGPGVHTVTYAFPGQCGSDSSITITVADPITVSDVQTQAVSCHGESDGSATLTVNGGSGSLTYAYSPESSAGANSNTPSGFSAGTVSYTITDAIGCTFTGTFTVTQPNPLQIEVQVNDANCGKSDGSAEVTNVTGGNSSFTYAWSNGETLARNDNLSPGAYSVTVTDNKGCSVNETVTVNTSPPPVFSLQKQDPTCFESADGAIQAVDISNVIPPLEHYLDGALLTGDVANNLDEGTYEWRIVDAVGCTATEQIEIIEPTPVTVQLPYGRDTLCINQLDSLVGQAQGGNGGPYTYEWSTESAEESDQDKLVYGEAGNYYFQAWDHKNCPSNKMNLLVYQHQPLAVSGSADPALICSGETVEYNAVASGGNGTYTFQWSSGQQMYPETLGVLQTPMYGDTANPASMQVIVFDGCSPPDTAVIPVQFHPNPQPRLKPQQGCEPLTVTLEDTSNTAQQWAWVLGDDKARIQNFSGNGTVVPALDAAQYSVTLLATNSFGCETQVVVNDLFSAYPLPEAEIIWSPRRPDINSGQLQLRNTNNQYITDYQWMVVDRSAVLDSLMYIEKQPLFEVPKTATTLDVSLRVETAYGCLDSAFAEIRIREAHEIFVPNTFSPNKDGINEIFIPETFNIEPKGYQLQIFNRWGEQIFSTSDLYEGWDGSYRGELVKPGVYVWRITYTDHNGKKQNLTGNVTLLD